MRVAATADINLPPPLERLKSHPGEIADAAATVISHVPVNAEYWHLILKAPDPAPLAVAGQFFNIECPHTDTDQPFLRRPMSVYKADAAKGEVEFLYKVTGAGTRGLATLQPGQSLRIFGPLGVGFTLEPDWQHIVVLGRGVGLATLAPLAELARSRHVGVTAILSARSPDYVMSVNRFRDIGADVDIVLDTDGTSDPAHVERLLRDLARRKRADAFFTCGSNRLMLLMQRVGADLGIPGEVAMEQQMACGIGMCFCCVRDFKSGDDIVHRRVCIEGPVFKLQEALSW